MVCFKINPFYLEDVLPIHCFENRKDFLGSKYTKHRSEAACNRIYATHHRHCAMQTLLAIQTKRCVQEI